MNKNKICEYLLNALGFIGIIILIIILSIIMLPIAALISMILGCYSFILFFKNTKPYY